jgi:hypothetical protein
MSNPVAGFGDRNAFVRANTREPAQVATQTVGNAKEMLARLEALFAEPDGVELGRKWAETASHRTSSKTPFHSEQIDATPEIYVRRRHTATNHPGTRNLMVLIDAILPDICNMYLLGVSRILISLWEITCT